MRLVAYTRVSDISENIENQRYAILEFAAKHGYQVSAFFEDVGVSGALPPLGRPGFAEAFNALKECDGIVVYALDRVARSLTELVNIVRKIESMGKVIVSVRESWLNELDPRIRSLIVAVLGWAGEMEREFIRERTREALKRAKMQGKKVGRPRKVSEVLIRAALKYIERGYTLKDAAKLLNIGYTTLAKAITQDPTYREQYYLRKARKPAEVRRTKMV
ncbi:MAG: recombinase family protein [Thermofilaceae archaeon]|nr:recombinase family protein [Thermofilaceae archaeon]MDW8004947.1 recombinase family protein [Thermofilaceae archaeon]